MIDSYKIMSKILEKDESAYIEVTGVKGEFEGVTGLAAPVYNSNLVRLWIGDDDGSDDCDISIDRFNREFIVSDIYREGGASGVR